MKADMIIKNAKIYTADRDHPLASALAVKDGKFVYVGDEAGLSAYEGEVTDLGGKFIMPGIIDSHVHVTMPIGFEYKDMGEYIMCDSLIILRTIRAERVTISYWSAFFCMVKRSQRKILMLSVPTVRS